MYILSNCQQACLIQFSPKKSTFRKVTTLQNEVQRVPWSHDGKNIRDHGEYTTRKICRTTRKMDF